MLRHLWHQLQPQVFWHLKLQAWYTYLWPVSAIPLYRTSGAPAGCKIKRCKAKALYKQHPEMWPSFLGPSLSEMNWHKWKSGKVWCGLTSPHVKLFLEIRDVVSSRPIKKRTSQTVISKFKSQHLRWYGGVLVPVAWVTCTDSLVTNGFICCLLPFFISALPTFLC